MVSNAVYPPSDVQQSNEAAQGGVVTSAPQHHPAMVGASALRSAVGSTDSCRRWKMRGDAEGPVLTFSPRRSRPARLDPHHPPTGAPAGDAVARWRMRQGLLCRLPVCVLMRQSREADELTAHFPSSYLAGCCALEGASKAATLENVPTDLLFATLPRDLLLRGPTPVRFFTPRNRN